MVEKIEWTLKVKNEKVLDRGKQNKKILETRRK